MLEPPIKGILKSKSGGVGFMPMDLNLELKNRLKRSSHATVANVRKSTATTSDATNVPAPLESTAMAKTSSSSDDEGAAAAIANKSSVESQKNLAHVLLNVSKENSAAPAIAAQHDDAVSLVRNLSSLGKSPVTGAAVDKHGGGGGGSGGAASTSEGESSGGREISEIIKNSAVARRRKLNDG